MFVFFVKRLQKCQITQEVERELGRQEEDLLRRLREVEEEGRLGREEIELRSVITQRIPAGVAI